MQEIKILKLLSLYNWVRLNSYLCTIKQERWRCKDKIKASLIYKLLTANFNKFYKPKISSEINAEQSDHLFYFFFNLIFWHLFVITLLFWKSFRFSSRNKFSICYKYNSFKTFRHFLAFFLILEFKKTTKKYLNSQIK